MSHSAAQLRHDIERIWLAGVAAVAPDRLVAAHLQVESDLLIVDDHVIDLRAVNRIAIVGAGKAAGALAVAIEAALGSRLLAEKNVTGWVNVPADCVLPSQRIVLHAARPAGVNEPRPEGVEGTRRILEIASSLGPSDLCICVLTGGGSALLPAPVPEISLPEKIELTRFLSAAGANIEELNTVRRQISLIKGGGLARACNAGQLVTLIISDVLGDPLESIGSGPTVFDTASTPRDALEVLSKFHLLFEPTIQPIVRFLKQRAAELSRDTPVRSHVLNFILGNNATAVDAAGVEAERLGYSHAMISATRAEGPAEDVGRHLASIALRMRSDDGPDCLISGGEPTVTLVDPAIRGRGGRNQQLALAALIELDDCYGVAMLAAGTDGEDGPTDAAGALVTPEIASAAAARHLDPGDYLERNDAYSFFEKTGGLFITGPTHTNVCDLRVIAVERESTAR